jgi:antitoxin (DNA-binding transcriptional repressor) of toxin-antitoxin stability system
VTGQKKDAGGIVITKHGKPVVKVIPIEYGCAHLIGALKGKIRIHGNAFSTGLEWDADKLTAQHHLGRIDLGMHMDEFRRSLAQVELWPLTYEICGTPAHAR